jgi:multicomponent K+:H+ antiporter subunit E
VKVLPAPLASLALWALWLVLAREVTVRQVILGGLLALFVPALTVRLRPTKVTVKRPLVVLRYVVHVVRDVIVSNFQVALGVIAPRWKPPRAKFVTIPLELRDPSALAVLSLVTAIVPGTVWSELALDRSALLLHVWDVDDEPTFVAHFKQRYEQPLREIFE